MVFLYLTHSCLRHLCVIVTHEIVDSIPDTYEYDIKIRMEFTNFMFEGELLMIFITPSNIFSTFPARVLQVC